MRYFLIVISVLIMDLASKFYVRSNFELYESRPVIEDVFHLTYIENPGAAFGMLANKTVFFLIITVSIIVALIYYMKLMEKEDRRVNIFLAMVIGGAIGNFVDRFTKQSVTDFFDFRIWPIFNIADSFIVVGMFFTAIIVLFGKGRVQSEK